MQKVQSEATADLRRIPFHLVDETDGITAETGETGGQPQISKNGGGFVNTSATLVSIGNGAYYVILTATELNTLGFIMVRFKSAATAEFQISVDVIAQKIFSSAQDVNLIQISGDAQSATDLKDFADDGYDPATNKVEGVKLNDTTTTNTDMVAEAPLASANADAVLDELLSGHTSAGSLGKAVADIEIDTNEMQGKLPTNNIMGSSVKTDKDDEIDVKAKTDLLAFTAGNVHSHTKVQDNLALTAQQKLDVNTEVDTALDENIPEPTQIKPPALNSIRGTIGYVNQANRNTIKVNKTTGFVSFHDDAGVVTHKKQLIDDGNEFEEREAVTGP